MIGLILQTLKDLRVLDYKADPDIRAILVDGRLAIPGDLDEAEAGRLHRFLTCDQVLERFYRENPPPVRPPENDLRAAADSAMAVYDQRSEHLSVGWQKFAVLQAGIAGSPENLDSAEIQDWAYSRIEENPNWLVHEDVALDDAKPLDWLSRMIGPGVFLRRQLMEQPPLRGNQRKRAGFRPITETAESGPARTSRGLCTSQAAVHRRHPRPRLCLHRALVVGRAHSPPSRAG